MRSWRPREGLIRQHQFDKVELVQLVKPEDSFDALEALEIPNAEILQSGHWLLQSPNGTFRAGATYDHEDLTSGPTKRGREQILVPHNGRDDSSSPGARSSPQHRRGQSHRLGCVFRCLDG
mgnify:CR=1 FL=1